MVGMRVERVRLPALAEENDPLGRKPGEALCPERFDEVALAGIRADVGPTAWAALYQQRPTPAGGNMFKRSSFRQFVAHTDNGKTWYELGEKVVLAEHCWRFATFDPAFVKGRRSDFTAIGVWEVAPTDPTSLLLVHVARVRLEAAEHVPMVRQVWEQFRPSWIGVEKQNATLSTWAELQREGVVLRWLIAEKNKIARAETAVAIADAGRLWVPRNAAWLPEYLEELVTFPAGAHDDQVDITSYACIELARRAVHVRTPKSEPSTHEERCWVFLERKRKQQRRGIHPVLGRF